MKENNFEDILSEDLEDEVENIDSPETDTDSYIKYFSEPLESEKTDIVIEPVVEPVVEPVAEPVIEPIIKPAVDTTDKVALYSESNLFKFKLGELKVGYNIVSKEDANIWLKSKRVRIATPEEVAQYYKN